jgi:hypothetical protein
MIPTGGIGQQLDQLKGLSIQELMQRQSVDPQLVYALALQEKQKMEAAKERQAAMGMETSQGTEIEKMEADLASRRAPGVQIAAQRSMPQPQMSQGIAGVPSPNMGAIGRAQGGIIGYAKGGMPETGAKSKGPIPQMSPEENAMVLKYLEGLKKFDYYDKNPDKVSPEGRQALEQDRRTFEAQFPNSFRQKVNQMMYGPSKGMAMGGEVKRYQTGDLVEGEDEFAIVATGPNGEQYTADDVRLLMSQGAIVREADAPEPSTRIDNVMRRERLAAEADRERERQREKRLRELERQRRIEEDGPRQTAAEAAFTALSGPVSAAGRGINTALSAIGEDILPEVKSYITDKAREGITALQNRVAEQEKQRAFNAEQAQADAIGMRPPTREQAFKELLQPLMDRKQSVDNAMTDITGAGAGQGQSTVQTQGAGQSQDKTPPPPPKEGGIRSALTKAKPVADKIAGVLEVLGRGAGASKGFEGAKIVEESRKLREAQADRDARLAEQKALLSARKEELDARNAVAMNMSAAEYAAQLTDDAIMMSDEFAAIEERLKDEAGFFMNADEKESIRRKLADAIKTIRQRKLSEYQSYLKGNLPGVSGQEGVEGAGERIIESADFF